MSRLREDMMVMANAVDQSSDRFFRSGQSTRRLRFSFSIECQRASRQRPLGTSSPLRPNRLRGKSVWSGNPLPSAEAAVPPGENPNKYILDLEVNGQFQKNSPTNLARLNA
jgi:hypothetical protein